MPIIVKDYTWTQTADKVHIRIPLRVGKHDKVDLFTSDCYVKAHFNPFFVEIFLLNPVDINRSKCLVKEDIIVLDLQKCDEVDWATLEKDLSKAEKMALKQQVMEKCQEEAKQASEDKRIKKSQLDRFTVQQAMEIDTKQHAIMDSRRDAERKKAMDGLEEWRVAQLQGDTQSNARTIEGEIQKASLIELSSSDDESQVTKKATESKGQGDMKTSTEIIVEKVKKASITELPSTTEISSKKQETKPRKAPPPRRPVKTPVKSEYVDKKKEEAKKRVLPKMRETANMEIKHTPRTFPTPTRESTAREEEVWLKNVTMARRATGFVSEDLRPEEQDPQWCKHKGDEFFRAGNFLGAISAYTHGITLSDKLPSLYANRAATHFAMGNFNKCLNDSSTALELMQPACEGNRHSRAKCIARRAAALARVGYLNKAIEEMKAASKLMPEDETIKKDIYDMERAWEQNPDSD